MKYIEILSKDKVSENNSYLETIKLVENDKGVTKSLIIHRDKHHSPIFDKDLVKFTPVVISPQTEKMLKGKKYAFGKLELMNYHMHLVLSDGLMSREIIYFDRPIESNELESLNPSYNKDGYVNLYKEYKNYLIELYGEITEDRIRQRDEKLKELYEIRNSLLYLN